MIIANGFLYAVTIYKTTCGRKKVRSNKRVDKWGEIMGSVGLFVLLGKYFLFIISFFVYGDELTLHNIGGYV